MSNLAHWPQKPFRLTYTPRVYAVIFLAANLLLAYFPLGLLFKLMIVLAGILLPLALAFRTAPPLKGAPLESDHTAALPVWFWAAFWGIAVALRLFWIPSLTAWPMWDDAAASYYSVGQVEHWQWKLFYSSESLPPLFIWMLALFYKLFPPSLFSLKLFPSLLSLAALAAGLWAGRRFFPQTLAALFAGALAFGFWPLFVGTFCQIMVLFLLWELLCLGLLGGCLHPSLPRRPNLAAFGLGLGLGAGLYIWIMALPVILVLSLVFLWSALGERPRPWPRLFSFGAPLLLLALPISLGLLRNILAGHVGSYLLFSHSLSAAQGPISLSYLTAILWGTVEKSYFNFGPLWGGYLNPIQGVAFLLGLVEIFRLRQKRYFYGLAALLALGLLPGMASTTVEVMRILPLLPLALALTALGWNRWVLSLSRHRRLWGLALSAVFSIGLDLYHLGGPFHQWAVPGVQSQDSKSPERYRAFQVLDQVQAQEGPGLILTEFVPNIFDQSLLVTTYPFNAARNPTLDPQKARWVAVLAPHYFEPYFKKRFPDVRSYPLYGDLPALEGNLALFLFPLRDAYRPIAWKWLEAHRRIQDLFGLMPYHVRDPDYAPAVQRMESCRDSFAGDLFLRCSYWDKLADLQARDKRFTGDALQSLEKGIQTCRSDPSLRWEQGYFWENLGKVFQDRENDDRAAVDAFHRGLRLGYESLTLYKKLVLSEVNLGNYQDALWAVEQCQRLSPDPSIPGIIQWLRDRIAAQK